MISRVQSHLNLKLMPRGCNPFMHLTKSKILDASMRIAQLGVAVKTKILNLWSGNYLE